jgi:hypothetical protein
LKELQLVNQFRGPWFPPRSPRVSGLKLETTTRTVTAVRTQNLIHVATTQAVTTQANCSTVARPPPASETAESTRRAANAAVTAPGGTVTAASKFQVDRAASNSDLSVGPPAMSPPDSETAESTCRPANLNATVPGTLRVCRPSLQVTSKFDRNLGRYYRVGRSRSGSQAHRHRRRHCHGDTWPRCRPDGIRGGRAADTQNGASSGGRYCRHHDGIPRRGSHALLRRRRLGQAVVSACRACATSATESS